MIIRRTCLLCVGTAILCLSALCVESYRFSYSISWERTGQLPLATTSTGAQVYRGQLLFFRTGVFRGVPGALSTGSLRYWRNNPRYPDLQLDRKHQAALNFAGIKFYKVDKGVGPVPVEGRYLQLPILLPVLVLAVSLAFALRKRFSNRLATQRGFEAIDTTR